MGLHEDAGKGLSIIHLTQDDMMDEDDPSKGLFGDAASFVISFTHSCFEKITYLPFPLGFIISTVEGVMEPVAHPVVKTFENSTLSLLMAIDDEIYAVGTFVEGCIVCSARRLKSILSVLRKRGLIGSAADLWVTYEAALRENMQKIVDLANRVPLVNLITPIVCAISAPLARAISDWLVKQSQVHEKGVYVPFMEGRLIGAKDETTDAQMEKPVLEKQEEEVMEDGASPTKDAALGGPDREGIEEVEDVEKAEEPSKPIAEEDVSTASDVLELIDSGWAMGSAVLSPKSSPASHRTFLSPRRPPLNIK